MTIDIAVWEKRLEDLFIAIAHDNLEPLSRLVDAAYGDVSGVPANVLNARHQKKQKDLALAVFEENLSLLDDLIHMQQLAGDLITQAEKMAKKMGITGQSPMEINARAQYTRFSSVNDAMRRNMEQKAGEMIKGGIADAADTTGRLQQRLNRPYQAQTDIQEILGLYAALSPSVLQSHRKLAHLHADIIDDRMAFIGVCMLKNPADSRLMIVGMLPAMQQTMQELRFHASSHMQRADAGIQQVIGRVRKSTPGARNTLN